VATFESLDEFVATFRGMLHNIEDGRAERPLTNESLSDLKADLCFLTEAFIEKYGLQSLRRTFYKEIAHSLRGRDDQRRRY